MKNLLGLFVLITSFVWAMEDPAPFRTGQNSPQGPPTGDAQRPIVTTSYLQLLPIALATEVLPAYVVSEKNPRDNRQDLVIERSKALGIYRQLVRDLWNSEIDQAALVDQIVSHMNTNPSERSHYDTNAISVTTALALAHEKMKRAIIQRMPTFSMLEHKQKNVVVVDVIKACPDFEVIEQMIHLGASVHAQDPASRCTLLHFAARNGDVRILELLLQKGAHVDALDRLDATPLHTAVHYGRFNAVKKLLEYKAQVNLWDWHKNSALYYAVLYNDTPLAELLLQHGASIYFYDTAQDNDEIHDDIFKRNVLAVAAFNKNHVLVKRLLEARPHSAPPSAVLEMMINAALVVAAKQGDRELAHFFLSLGDPRGSVIQFGPHEARPKIMPDRVFEEHSAVGYALLNDHFRLAEDLFVYSTDNYATVMPHCRASRRDSLRIAVQKLCELSIRKRKSKRVKQLKKLVSLFLDEKVEPARGLRPSAAFIAAQYGNTRLLSTLLAYAKKQEPLVDQKLLFEAALAGSARAVRAILSLGTSATIVDREGDTPLHKAVLLVDEQNLQLVDDLIDHGADAAIKNSSKGDTPLHKALKHPHKNEQEGVIKKLLDHLEKQGRLFHINAQNKEGNTPLMSLCALSNNAGTLIRLLISKGACCDIKNAKGQTALFIAAAHDSLENVEALLENKANPNITNGDGCGPLTKAARNGNEQMINALIQAGAKLDFFKDGMLREAAKGGHISCMRWLIAQGANRNGKSTSYGNTPLHKAVAYRQYDAIDFLIGAGADIGAKNDKGETPLDLALGLPDAESASLLYRQLNLTARKNHDADAPSTNFL